MATIRPVGFPKLKEYKPTRFMANTSHYDKVKADRAVLFIESLKHTKGKWEGKPFFLLPWQEQIVRDIFGIIKEDGKRQFRSAYIEIAKKNGKSELAAAVALYMLYADNEPSAEVYGAAADRQQASIVFDVARRMVEMTPALYKRSKITLASKRLVNFSNSGFYQVLSADVVTKHGLNISGLIFDELHTQPNRKLFDVLTKGSGDAREQPLYFYITTAGNNRNSICYELHMKAKDIIEGRKIDTSFYPVIFGLETDEDWHNEENWYKANPSLGYTIQFDRLQEAYFDALQNLKELFVSAYNEFVTLKPKSKVLDELIAEREKLIKQENELNILKLNRLIELDDYNAELEKIKNRTHELTLSINDLTLKGISQKDYVMIDEFDEEKVRKFLDNIVLNVDTVTFNFINGISITKHFDNGPSGNQKGWKERRKVNAN